MTATTTLPTIPVATGLQSDGDRIVLRDISWERYTQLRDDPAQMRIRMTFHNGVLELLSPSGPHERIKRLIEGLVTAWCEAQEIAVASFGSTTCRSEPKKSGLEPDTCFYIENEPRVRNHEDLDLQFDPPPDLSIEIDISASSLGRLPVYLGLRVPEVWRTNGVWLKIYCLANHGYEAVSASLALPGFQPEKLLEFLARRTEIDEITLIREFRTWAATQKPSSGSDA